MNQQNKSIPPAELTDLCAKLNDEWLRSTGTEASPYLQESSHGDEWRITIKRRDSGFIICRHLDPKTADGHTYYILASAAHDSYQCGRLHGKKEVLLRQFTEMANMNGMSFKYVIESATDKSE